MTAADAVAAVARVIGAAVILQTLELWMIRRVAADDGVWRWATIRRELDVFPSVVRRLLDVCLSYRGFVALLVARMVAAGSLLATPTLPASLILLVSTVLLALRWRGSVNGGSDFMTLVVLTALAAATAFPDRPLVQIASLFYIALQTCNSYFLAGLVKLRSAAWRDGSALPAFLATAVHDASWLRAVLLRHRVLSQLAGWTVIALECSAPLALLHPTACAVLVALLLAFHVGNVYVFGLSRFVWAWAATYPALFFASHLVRAIL